MSFNELDQKRIEKEMNGYIEKNRPPVEIRNEIDISYKIEKFSIIIFEIRPKWNEPDEKIEVPIAKATYVQAGNIWKIFWQKSDMKWHKYDPLQEVNTVKEFIDEVDKDQYGCFWG